MLGAVDLPAALTVSSDVYFYTVGNEFWKAYRDEGQAAGHTRATWPATTSPTPSTRSATRIQHTARTYGFGESTGIGLGDQAGVIPDHEFRVKLNPDNADAAVLAPR